MNTTTPYEQLIAAKLDQIPVPDMADGIWAGIEAQLDAVVDTPDKNAPDKSPVRKFGGKGWLGFAGIMAAATLLWWYYQPQHPAPLPATPPAVQPLPPAPLPVTDSPGSIEKQLPPPAAVPVQKDTFFLKTILAPAMPADSASEQELLPVKADTVAVQHQQERYFDSIYLLPRYKKPKGVKGITDDDYRINVSKDSLKKE